MQKLPWTVKVLEGYRNSSRQKRHGECKTLIPLNLQYKDGELLVFVLTNKNTNEIYGILDTVNSADNKKFKLSKLGIPTNDLKTQCYKVLAQ